jgi:TonB-dependent starch-binding outer membrane protein SusC
MQKSFTVKLWKLMKICAAQIVIALTLCGIAVAHSNFAQVLDQQITITLTDTPFEEALKKIAAAADIKFAYSISQLRKESSVTIRAEQRMLRDILSDVLGSRNIQYKVHEREKTITLKKDIENVSKAQSHIEVTRDDLRKDVLQITGTVKDAVTLQPMAGVNVIVRGTTRGTTSDADGNFIIEANDGEVLVFSFIGYAPMEIRLSGQTQVDVQLQEDITSLKEVVVNAGYWTVKKDEQTGNIVKVNAEDIQRQPVSNPIAALQGRVPGLEVIQQTGVPGGNFTIRIRGQNSIRSGNDPLFIIDGVPYTSSTLAQRETSGEIYRTGTGSNPLNAINPNDIQSIEILKDADATAIYGSRGANGVVLITTKKGEQGKTKVDLSFYSGVGSMERRMDLLSTPEYVRMRKEAFENDGLQPSANAPDLLLWDTTRYTDWQKQLLGGTARYLDGQFSISGGERNTQFLISSGYHRETTVFPGDNADQRVSLLASISNRSTNEKFSTTFSFSYSAGRTNLLRRDLTALALELPPNAPAIYKENGSLNWGPSAWTDAFRNPLSYTMGEYEARTSTLIGNASLNYSILPNLDVKASVGVTNTGLNAITTTPTTSFDPAVASLYGNTTAFSNSDFNNWIIEPQISWRPSGKYGKLDALVGMTYLSQENEAVSQYARGFSSEALMKNINAAPVILPGTSAYGLYRYNAVFGRLNYSVSEKYILNFTVRRDGSSRFGPEKQFANFGAIGAAWIFSRENFFPEDGVLSFGKIRGSFGITGNDQIGDYQYLETYSTKGSGQYHGKTGLKPQRLYNADFGWESNQKLEVGTELGFIRDRITTEISYYRNRSSNQLLGMQLPPTTGFSSIQSNFPATVQNTGFEVIATGRVIDKNHMLWTTSFNISVPRNKLIEFKDLESSQEFGNRFVLGEPLSIRRVYRFIGVNPETGIYEFEDFNQDGNLDIDDRYVLKFVGVKSYGGWSNSFRYKGFTVDFVAQFVQQSGNSHVLNSSQIAPGRQSNQTKSVLDRWTMPGDVDAGQRFSTSAAYQNAYANYGNSDRSVTDASFIRLKTISVSYLIPVTWTQRAFINQAKLFLQGQNILTLTNYQGLDPENGNSALPPLRVITGGFHLTF